MPTEDEINAMFPVQREVIARAALAGCRFEKVALTRHINQIGVSGWRRGETVPCTEIDAFLPGDRYIGRYEDEFSAAITCIDYIEGRMDLKAPAPIGFTLDEGNEQ
jgi:hypothetical protein